MVLSCSPGSHSTSINCRLCFYESLTNKAQGFYLFIFWYQIRAHVTTPLSLTCVHVLFLELEKKSGNQGARNVFRNCSSFHVGCSLRSVLAVGDSRVNSAVFPRLGGTEQLHLEEAADRRVDTVTTKLVVGTGKSTWWTQFCKYSLFKMKLFSPPQSGEDCRVNAAVTHS